MTDTDFMKHPAYNDSKFAFVMLDGPHTTKDVLTEAIWFANKSAPRCRIVFDDWITYKMDLIKNVMKEYDFEVIGSEMCVFNEEKINCIVLQRSREGSDRKVTYFLMEKFYLLPQNLTEVILNLCLKE